MTAEEMPRHGDLGARRLVQTGLGEVAVHERGPEDGTPIVLLHGVLVNADLFAPLVDELAQHHRCICLDLPLGAHAVGTAAQVRTTVPAVVEAIAEVISSLDRGPVVLVANDTGGALAQVLMTSRPELLSAVVLTPCDAFDNFLPLAVRYTQLAARLPGGIWCMAQLLRSRLVRRLPIAFGMLMERPFPPELWASVLVPARRSREVRRDVGQFLASISRRYTREAARALPQFTAPVLLAWCDDDRVFPRAHAHRLAELLPNAEVVELPGTRAFLPWDQPTVLAGHVNDFLRAHAIDPTSVRPFPHATPNSQEKNP